MVCRNTTSIECLFLIIPRSFRRVEEEAEEEEEEEKIQRRSSACSGYPLAHADARTRKRFIVGRVLVLHNPRVEEEEEIERRSSACSQ